MPSPYESGLERRPVNCRPLSPLSFLARSALVWPQHPAIIHGAISRTWAETFRRCRRLASALSRRGIGRNDTVSCLLPNIPEHYELHYAVPMAGAVLNSINTRLDAATVAYILDHGRAVCLIVDRELAPLARQALALTGRRPLLVAVDDPCYSGDAEPVDGIGYEALLGEGDPDFPCNGPDDEWDAITLNYTSGTTGKPKGVVYHHRGACLNAISNIIDWGVGRHPVYLWTLPMFHCNGWCFPWSTAAVAATSVCLRRVDVDAIYQAFATRGITHLNGAPTVLNMLLNARPEVRAGVRRGIRIGTAGAPPPPAVIHGMEEAGFIVTHLYGLTETYGPAVVCAWHEEWNSLPEADRLKLKKRQGVPYTLLGDLAVMDPDTMTPVPADGETMGEIMFRGNVVMKGYLDNPEETEKCFAGDWFHSGDLGVMHPDGYVEIRDRSKDIIISGGENVSSVEVENVLFAHPAVLEAAVVARPDEKWGETPCAYVTLKPGHQATGDELVAFCRRQLAGFKCPKTVIFMELPKTSTGKIQKFRLRAHAQKLGAGGAAGEAAP